MTFDIHNPLGGCLFIFNCIYASINTIIRVIGVITRSSHNLSLFILLTSLVFQFCLLFVIGETDSARGVAEARGYFNTVWQP